MSIGSKKGWGTKDATARRPPRYPTDKEYRETYINTLETLGEQQQAIINNEALRRNERRAATNEFRRIEQLVEQLNTEKEE